jgi:hypothetical protein
MVVDTSGVSKEEVVETVEEKNDEESKIFY